MPLREAIVALDETSATPPYLQIFAQIRAAIERGEFAPGHASPTVRQLTGDLGVAPNTVARAYADLKTEDYLSGEQRRLTHVAASPAKRSKTARRCALADSVAAFLASLTSRGYASDEIARELRRMLPTLEV